MALALAAAEVAVRAGPERWLDLCAGPGGKAGLLATAVSGAGGVRGLLAADVVDAGTKRLVEPGTPGGRTGGDPWVALL